MIRDKTFKVATDSKDDGCQRGLASMVYKFFDKKSSGSGLLLNQITNSRMKIIGRSLENRRDEKFIHLLETIFGVLI